jgi:hypothetical protein
VARKTKRTQIRLLVFLGSWVLGFLAFRTNKPILKIEHFMITNDMELTYDIQPSNISPKNEAISNPSGDTNALGCVPFYKTKPIFFLCASLWQKMQNKAKYQRLQSKIKDFTKNKPNPGFLR